MENIVQKNVGDLIEVYTPEDRLPFETDEEFRRRINEERGGFYGRQ